MNCKHNLVQKWRLLAAGMVAVMLTVSQLQVLAKSGGKSNDPYEHLRDPHGKALRIKIGCAVGSSSGVARADFNHDGYGDLAIGAPYENVGGAENAGAVYVIYGSPSGLLAPASSGPTPLAQRWTQSSSGVPGGPEKDDNFGMALAAGDFDNDGISDLAIGAPGESVSTVANGTPFRTGSVTILYGRLQEGLVASSAPSLITMPALGSDLCGVIVLDGDCSGRLPTYESAAEDVARFGSSLTWGDFDGDGLNDLAVGAPNAAVNKTVAGVTYSTKYAGIVVILFEESHSPMTADLNYSSILHQSIPFYPGPSGDSYAEPYDEFGTTLAAGKFNGTRTDLVVGVPYEDIGSVAGGGMVQVFNNCGTAANPQFCPRDLSQAASGVPGTPEASDLFGFSLATGDFDGYGQEELVVGVPYENIGSLVNAGAVQVFHGADAGLSFSNSELWTQSDIFGSSPNDFDGSPSEENDLSGYSLATADFNGDGKQDLAIGVPYEDVITTRDGTNLLNLAEAGEVDVLYGSGSGLSKTERAPQMWHQDRPNVEGQVEEGDHFGFTLSAWNFSGPDVLAYLAIGVPREDVNGISNCGAGAVLYSTTANNGLSSLGDQLWYPGAPNVPGSRQTNGKFGTAMY